jgi:hypothetical protein
VARTDHRVYDANAGADRRVWQHLAEQTVAGTTIPADQLTATLTDLAASLTR